MNTFQRKVLVFPAGTEIGLEIYNALKHCKEVVLFGAGQDISNHARFAFPSYHVIPSVHEEGWLDGLVSLVNELGIDYIFPAYDDVVLALGERAKSIPATIVSSPLEACKVTRSKSATYKALEKILKVPQLFNAVDEVNSYPVLVKPDKGQGSQGVQKVCSVEELESAVRDIKEPIICEYLPGDEYTIDCFSDRERGLLFAGARRRVRTRNGISVNTVTEYLPEGWDLAEKIGATLNLRGAWFFQLKRAVNGDLALLEVAPRIAGAMAAHRVLGVNFPLLSIFEHERMNVKIRINPGSVEMDRALLNRYRHQVDFSVAYVDLDDTLILNGAVNLTLVRFVFQCINAGKSVRLITRHAGNLSDILQKHRLSELFDDIIHIKDGSPKSAYIIEKDAIFIDDSFSERSKVVEDCNVLTFDASMIDLLVEQAECLKGDGYGRR